MKKLKAIEAKAITELEQATQLARELFSTGKPEVILALWDTIPPRATEPSDHAEAVMLLKSAIAIAREAFPDEPDPMLALEIFDRLFGDEDE